MRRRSLVELEKLPRLHAEICMIFLLIERAADLMVSTFEAEQFFTTKTSTS